MTQVEGTNDYSIVSKLSAAQAGYFDDPFLTEFVENPRNRAPLINWGYYVRNKSIQLTFEKSVQFLANKNQPFQILSIGAGFDTTFFSIHHKYKPDNLTFFEIDLPCNVERKVNLIFNSEKCQPMIWNKVMNSNDGKSINTDLYRLFACDLADTGQLKQKLEQFDFDFKLPTLILSECVITYMKEKHSSKLVSFLAEVLEHAAFFVYEQCLPDDGFGAFMVKHFENIGSPIMGLEKFKTESEQVNRYLEAGWCKCKVYTLTSIFLNMDTKEVERIKSLDQFDEFEEFLLKCSHYFMLVATKGSCDILHGVSNIRNLHAADYSNINIEETPLQCNPVLTPHQMKRFGHSICVRDDKVTIVGGFGQENEKHKRIGSCVSFQYDKGEFTKVTEFKNPVFERLFGSVESWNEKLCLIGGRHSPNKPIKEISFTDEATGECVESSFVPDIGSRWRQATCLLNHSNYSSQDILVIVGGCDVKKVYDDVIFYNLRERTIFKTKLDNPVVSGSVCTWGEKILISGGQNPVRRTDSHNWWHHQEVIWILQVEGKEVKKKKVVLDLEPRFGHTSHVIADSLLLVGGVGPFGPLGLDVINLITGEITRHNLPVFKNTKHTNIIMLHNHASFIKEDELVIIGGGGNCFSFGTHINNCWSINLSHILTK